MLLDKRFKQNIRDTAGNDKILALENNVAAVFLEGYAAATDFVRMGLSPAHEHLDYIRAMMIEEEAVTEVECLDSFHVIISKSDVRCVEVLHHALFVSALRNDYHSALIEVCKRHLRNAETVLFGYFTKNRIGEESVATFGERSPRHDVCAIFLHDFLCLGLLVEHVCLHLIDSGNNLYIVL